MNIRNDNIQPFKYNGKEFDMMHGLYTYDYGARQYNPVVPSWDRMDPLGEAFQDVSPFAYCHNNPVNYIDINGMFDTQDEAVDYANSHYVGLSNVHYASDENEWFVAFGADGMGYSSGGTLERRFHEKASESHWWDFTSRINTNIGAGLGFVGWGLAKSLERSNAYALRYGTGRYINSATPTFRLGNIDIDFSLRGANAMAKGIKVFGMGLVHSLCICHTKKLN